MGATWSGSAVTATRPRQALATARRYSPAISCHRSPYAANSLPPFAMWSAFPTSDHYGRSATPRPAQSNTDLPALDPEGQATGQARDASHVHHTPVDLGQCPALPLRHRHEYAASFPRGLSTGDFTPHGSHPPTPKGRPGVHRYLAHIRQVAAGVSLERLHTLVPHVHLSVSLGRPKSSNSADPSRRCQGRSHPPRRLPAQAALSFTSLLRQTSDGVLPPPPGNAAPRGARKPKSKPLPVHSRRSAMTPGMPEKQTHDDARHGPQRRRRRQ